MTFTNEELLKVIEILIKQLDEEQRLRRDCIQQMLNLHNSRPENDTAVRIKNILESPGEIV